MTFSREDQFATLERGGKTHIEVHCMETKSLSVNNVKDCIVKDAGLHLGLLECDVGNLITPKTGPLNLVVCGGASRS